MKAVLFDMDGVLVDSELYYMDGTLAWMREKGFNGRFEDICKIVGTTMDKTYELLSEMIDGRLSKKEIEIINTQYFKEHPLDYKKIMKPYALELIKKLKEMGIKIAVCSSSPKDNIIHVLNICGYMPYLDYVVSGDEFEHSKPSPDIYLTAAKDLGVEIKDCIVIEDSKLGIDAGKNADMTVIAVREERFSQDQSRADYICNSMKEIESLLLNLL